MTTVDPPNSIGIRLRAAREECRLTLQAVAEKTGFAWTSVRGWERGESLPSLAKAAKLATLYGVTLDWLAGQPSPPDEDKLRPGLIVLDKEMADAILSTTDPDVIEQYCNWPGRNINMFDIGWRVPEGGCLASHKEVVALVGQIQRHIFEHAPKLVKKWTEVLGNR